MIDELLGSDVTYEVAQTRATIAVSIAAACVAAEGMGAMIRRRFNEQPASYACVVCEDRGCEFCPKV